jgi:hypothetical protein
MAYRVRGIAGLVYTEDELAIAGLTPDGMHVQAWVATPPGQTWAPEGGDLIWLPPNATKSTDLDDIGRVVDVAGDPEVQAFVTAEIDRHNKYLDFLRDKVRAGKMKLDAFVAKMLGVPFDEDGVELTPRVGSGPVAAYKSAAAERLVAEGRRLAGSGRLDDAQLKAIATVAAEEYAETGDIDAATDALLRTYRAMGSRSAPIGNTHRYGLCSCHTDSGLPVLPGSA